MQDHAAGPVPAKQASPATAPDARCTDWPSLPVVLELRATDGTPFLPTSSRGADGKPASHFHPDPGQDHAFYGCNGRLSARKPTPEAKPSLLPSGFAFRRSLYNGGNSTLHIVAGSKADGSFGGKAACGGPRWATWSAVIDPREAEARPYAVCKLCRKAVERMAPSPAALLPVDVVERMADAAGSHFFSPAALRFFKSRVGSYAYQDPAGRLFFTTSEQPPHGLRGYSVRVAYDPRTGRGPDAQAGRAGFTVDSLGPLLALDSTQEAQRMARALAEGRATCPSSDGRLLTWWDQAKADLLRATQRKEA